MKIHFKDVSELFEFIDEIHMLDNLSSQSQFDKLYEQIIDRKDETKKRRILECGQKVVNACKSLQIIERLKAYTGSIKVSDDKLKDVCIKGYVVFK